MQRNASLPEPAGYFLADAAQYMVGLHCFKDTLLTQVQLVLHQRLSSNQLHQQSWKVLRSPLGDYILFPSLYRHHQTGERRKGICRCFLCSVPFFGVAFLCFAWKPNWSSAHAVKPEPLPSFRRKEDNCTAGVSSKWDYSKLGHATWKKHPFRLGRKGWVLASFHPVDLYLIHTEDAWCTIVGANKEYIKKYVHKALKSYLFIIYKFAVEKYNKEKPPEFHNKSVSYFIHIRNV